MRLEVLMCDVQNEPIPQGIMMQEKPRYQTASKSHSFKFADEVIISNMESWDEARTLVTSQRYKSSGTEEHNLTEGISLT